MQKKENAVYRPNQPCSILQEGRRSRSFSSQASRRIMFQPLKKHIFLSAASRLERISTEMNCSSGCINYIFAMDKKCTILGIGLVASHSLERKIPSVMSMSHLMQSSSVRLFCNYEIWREKIATYCDFEIRCHLNQQLFLNFMRNLEEKI